MGTMTTTQQIPEDRPGTATVERGTDLAGLLLRAAAEFPEHGVRYCSGERALDHTPRTYPQLLDDSRRLLDSLRAAGVRPGRVVVLLLEQPEKFLPALWACLLGGITVCPLVPVRDDPQRWAAQLSHVHALLEGPLMVTDCRTRAELPAVEGLAVATFEELARAAADTDVRTVATASAAPDDVALLVLTSGSTGTAKAVRLTHGNLLASLAAKAETQSLTAADVTLNWISYDHVAALVEAHLLPLSVGAVQVQAAPESVLADPVRFLELIDAHRVTMTFAPNFLLGLINEALDRMPVPPRPDLSCLRHIISGGEANPVATGIGFLDRLAPYGLRQDVVVPAFGMTETCAGSVFNRDFAARDLRTEFPPLGRPVGGLRIRITDGEGRVVAATDEPGSADAGEVQLRGPMVTAGYFGDDEATAAAFTADGWFRTGDLGSLDADGRLTLVGRTKDSIIVNGVNYYSHDLEAALDELDDVRRGQVAAFPTRPDGADSEQLAVAFVPAGDAADDTAVYRAIVAIRSSTVMHWGFRPQLILPVTEEQIPRSNLGKIQRTRLRTAVEAGGLDAAAHRASEVSTRFLGVHVPPEGAAETALADIYARVLNVEAVPVTASFFDLGGTSLDVLRPDLPVLFVSGGSSGARTITARIRPSRRFPGSASVAGSSGMRLVYRRHAGAGATIGRLARLPGVALWTVAAGRQRARARAAALHCGWCITFQRDQRLPGALRCVEGRGQARRDSRLRPGERRVRDVAARPAGRFVDRPVPRLDGGTVARPAAGPRSAGGAVSARRAAAGGFHRSFCAAGARRGDRGRRPGDARPLHRHPRAQDRRAGGDGRR